jgi:hypothetical protein
MNNRKRTTALALLFLALPALISVPHAFGRERKKLSLYGAVRGFYMSDLNKGDFDGMKYLESDDELFLIPSVRGGPGVEGAFGVKFDLGSSLFQSLAVEAGYRASNHSYAFMDAESESTKADFRGVLINVRAYLFKPRAVQPFLYFDAAILSLKLRNGAYSYTAPPRVGDAAYSGMDIGFGAGAALRPAAGFSLTAAAGVHACILQDVEGVLGQNFRIQKVNGLYPRLEAGVAYAFKL